MEYLKLWADKLERLDECTLEEKGWILDACIRYQRGQEIQLPEGPEGRYLRLIWRDFQEMLDANAKKQAINAQNGKNGGRPTGSAGLTGYSAQVLICDENPTETEKNPTETEKNPTETENKPTEKPEEPKEAKKQETRNRNQESGDREKEPSTPKPPCRGMDGFVDFWAAYPRKEGKAAAEKAWAKLRPNEKLRRQIMDAIQQHRASPQWTKDGGQFVPHASTFLNGRRWEDKLIMADGARTVSAQAYAQRDYTEEELDAVGPDLIAEARAQRKAAAYVEPEDVAVARLIREAREARENRGGDALS